MGTLAGFDLDGRTALVTGGAGGMGAAICRDLASMGAQVVVADIAHDSARGVAESLPDGRGIALAVDLADPASITRFVDELAGVRPQIDILVSNAGWDKIEPFVKSSADTWDRLIAINLRGPIQLTHALLPGMMERGFGRLIFVSSDAARVGSTGEAVYSACKGGITAFAKTLAREAARSQVTSNSICPGPADTPMLHTLSEGNEALIEGLRRAIPLRRLAQPDDISGAVAFFASERGAFVTGQTLSVSGGLTMI